MTPVFVRRVSQWDIYDRGDGTHYAEWSGGTMLETAATIDDNMLRIERSRETTHASIPIAVVLALVELDAVTLRVQKHCDPHTEAPSTDPWATDLRGECFGTVAFYEESRCECVMSPGPNRCEYGS